MRVIWRGPPPPTTFTATILARNPRDGLVECSSTQEALLERSCFLTALLRALGRLVSIAVSVT